MHYDRLHNLHVVFCPHLGHLGRIRGQARQLPAESVSISKFALFSYDDEDRVNSVAWGFFANVQWQGSNTPTQNLRYRDQRND